MGILPYADAKVVTFHETTKYFGKNLTTLLINNRSVVPQFLQYLKTLKFRELGDMQAIIGQ